MRSQRSPQVGLLAVLFTAIVCHSTGSAAQPLPASLTSLRISPSATLSFARTGHTATSLFNGRVVVVGGMDGHRILSSTEVYDPGKDSWQRIASLTVPRVFHSATRLENGSLLVVGGASRCRPEASIERLVNLAAKWIEVGNLKKSRVSHNATLLGDGNVLITAGRASPCVDFEEATDIATTELCRPASGQCDLAAPIPGPRADATTARLNDGRVLIVGGAILPNRDGRVGHPVVWDPRVARWTETGSVGAGGEGATVTPLPGGRMLLVGASLDPMDERAKDAGGWVLDPTKLLWHAVPFSGLPRVRHAAVALTDGRVAVIGGEHSIEGTLLSDILLFDPVHESWSRVGTLPYSVRGHTATLLPDGSVLVVGGEVGPDGKVTNLVKRLYFAK